MEAYGGKSSAFGSTNARHKDGQQRRWMIMAWPVWPYEMEAQLGQVCILKNAHARRKSCIFHLLTSFEATFSSFQLNENYPKN
jgi:hypothetical protein